MSFVSKSFNASGKLYNKKLATLVTDKSSLIGTLNLELKVAPNVLLMF